MLAGEAPVGRQGRVVVPRREGEHARCDGGAVGGVVGREHVALDAGAGARDPGEPGGAGRQLDEGRVRIPRLQPLTGRRAAMAAAVIDHPEEDASGIGSQDREKSSSEDA